MIEDKKPDPTAHTSNEANDEDAANFAELLEDIRALKDDDTIVEHMDLAAYRKGKRT